MHELHGVFCPLHDVDLFPPQFLHDGLYPHASHTYASADGVNVLIVGHDGDFCSAAGVPCGSLDFNDSFINFRHFHLKQAHQENGMRTGKDDLRPARRAFDFNDVRPDSVPSLEDLTKRLFPARQKSLRFAEVNHQVTLSLNPRDDPIHEVALTMLELAIDHVPFGFTDFLNNHLFCCLRCNTAKIFKFMWNSNSFIQVRVRAYLSGVFKADLERVIRNSGCLNDFLFKVQGNNACFFIQTHTHILSPTEAFTTGRQDGRDDRLNQGLFLYSLLAADLINEM